MPEFLLHYSAITAGGLGGLPKNDETESDVGSDVTVILLLLRARAPRHQLNLEIGENQEEPEQCLQPPGDILATTHHPTLAIL